MSTHAPRSEVQLAREAHLTEGDTEGVCLRGWRPRRLLLGVSIVDADPPRGPERQVRRDQPARTQLSEQTPGLLVIREGGSAASELVLIARFDAERALEEQSWADGAVTAGTNPEPP